jgi:histidine triad (HIT) family protein
LSNPENCTFCQPDNDLESRIIYRGEDYYSFVSKPMFRPAHTLVAPTEHYERMSEIPHETLARMMGEAALLADWSDKGYGSVTLQKYQPLQTENGIKMDHAHVHIWPRTRRDEKNGIIIPAPKYRSNFFVPRTRADREYERRTLEITRRYLELKHTNQNGVNS